MKKGNKMHVEEFDFDCDLGLGDFFETLEKYNAIIVEFVAIGPAGGNPAVTLGFKTPEDLEAFSEFMGI